MIKIKITILLFFILSCSEDLTKYRVVTQVIDVENLKIYVNNNEWLFVDYFYSNEKLKNSSYVIDSINNIDNLFKNVSRRKKMNYKYFIYDKYTLKTDYGFINRKTILVDDFSHFKTIRK